MSFHLSALMRLEEAQRGLRRRCVELGLTESQARVLLCLSASAPLPPGRIAARTALNPSSVTGIADALESRSLVVRTRDPENRRRRPLLLTAEGGEIQAILIDAIGL